MKVFFRPRHTFSSVARQLYAGLMDGDLLLARPISSISSSLQNRENSFTQTIAARSRFGALVAFCILGLALFYLVYASPDSARLNISVSIVMFVAGLLVLFMFPPLVFSQFPYTQQAFFWWTMRWPVLGTIWTLTHYFPDQKRSLLALVDLASMCSLVFCWSFFRGRKLGWRELIYIGAIFFCLVWWNLLHSEDPHIWIVPSEIVSLSTIALTAVVVALRYGVFATSFVLIELMAALFQIPTYNHVFLGNPSSNLYSMAAPALAAAKLFSGSIFYALFSTESPKSDTVSLPIRFVNMFRRPLVLASLLFSAAIGLTVYIGLQSQYRTVVPAFMNGHWPELLTLLLLSLWILLRFRQTAILLPPLAIVLFVIGIYRLNFKHEIFHPVKYLVVILALSFWIPLLIFKWDYFKFARKSQSTIHKKSAAVSG